MELRESSLTSMPWKSQSNFIFNMEARALSLLFFLAFLKIVLSTATRSFLLIPPLNASRGIVEPRALPYHLISIFPEYPFSNLSWCPAVLFVDPFMCLTRAAFPYDGH